MSIIKAKWRNRDGFIWVCASRPWSGDPLWLAISTGKKKKSLVVGFLTAIAFWEPRAQVKFYPHSPVSSCKQLSISESVSREPLKDDLSSGPLDGFEALWLKAWAPEIYSIVFLWDNEILGKQGVRSQPKSSKPLCALRQTASWAAPGPCRGLELKFLEAFLTAGPAGP